MKSTGISAVFMFIFGLEASGASYSAAFPSGIAAGDTTTNSAVLWAQSATLGKISFLWSTNRNFIPTKGTTTLEVISDEIPVKVKIADLNVGTEYYYKVSDVSGNFLTGRFRTLSLPGTYQGLHFGVSGDWRGELRPFQALANAAKMNLDFFVALGDTVYADFKTPAVPLPQALSKSDFRIKNREVYSERFGVNTLADLRASTSTFAMIDDHEIFNGFEGGKTNASGMFENETELYQNGVSAFLEFNPIEDQVYSTPELQLTHAKPKLYRFRTFGRDAAIILLDTRSFRDPSLHAPSNPLNSDEITRFNRLSFDLDPLTNAPKGKRSLLSEPQLIELKLDLLRAKAKKVTWIFILVPEPIQNLGVIEAEDRFEGYARERSDLLSFIKAFHIQNVVFITADIHGTLVNNVNYRIGPESPDIASGAFEIVTGPVAFDKPFGPTVFDAAEKIEIAPGFNILTLLLSQAGIGSRAEFNALKREDKDRIFERILNTEISALGFDTIGLENSGIRATLLSGNYTAVHTYGWTEFEIDPYTQYLTVTTYGIPAYKESEIDSKITDIIPLVVNRFHVLPTEDIVKIPALSIIRAGTNSLISWPNTGVEYELQSTEDVTEPIRWSKVLKTPFVIGNYNLVVQENIKINMFFRLKKQ